MQASNDSNARVGDGVTIESHRLRGAGRTGVIAEVLGSAGYEYYRVRWQDGHESVLHPGTDAVLHVKAGRRVAQADPRAKTRQREERSPATEKPVPAKRSERSSLLRATPGDRLLIRGHHLGEPVRDAEILEVVGSGGGPPFRVRWWDTGREGILFPGSRCGSRALPSRSEARVTLDSLTQAALIEGLSRPSAYPRLPREVKLVQTHISLVFLAGDRVYKVKKPVDLGFVDYTTLERRRRFCEEEVRLNRRLAPKVYLGVVPITVDRDGSLRVGGRGETVEVAVEMRRLPADRMLDRLLDRGEIDNEQMEALAAPHGLGA